MTNSDNDARPVPKRRREAPAQPDPMAPTGAPSRSAEAPPTQPAPAQPAPTAAPAAAERAAMRLAPALPAQEQGEVPIYLRVSPLLKSEFKELHTALGITGKELFQLMVKESRARYARTGTI